MRRLLRAAIPALLLLGLVHQGGCSLFHDPYPDKHCEDSTDCFQQQGETCDLTIHQCVGPAGDGDGD